MVAISEVLKLFGGISLAEMDRVGLMNRTDRKFWFNVSHLEELLRLVCDHYYILEIEGESLLPYATTYFDTPQDCMYSDHHRGKLNRFKIRRRSYLASNSAFLEIKFKSNTGRTIKRRMATHIASHPFDADELRFIGDNTPYCGEELREVMVNNFRRIMLVSKSVNERCTIDIGLRFSGVDHEVDLDRLIVVEVKSEGRARSRIIDAMRSLSLRSSGFSKYCIGRSLLDRGVRSNNWRLKHRLIEREIGCGFDKITKLLNNDVQPL